MASSNADLKTRISTLGHEILSYKPGKAVPYDDERVVFPDKLVIGMVDLCGYPRNVVHILRCALYGEAKEGELADKYQKSTEDQEEYLTDSISIIMLHFRGLQKQDVQDLAGKVGCMVMLDDHDNVAFIPPWFLMIHEVTGRDPLCAVLHNAKREAIVVSETDLNQLGITDIYYLGRPGHIFSDRDRVQWLDLIHGCLQEGDRVLAINKLKGIKLTRREVERLQTGEDERARAEKEKRSLVAEMTKKLESKQHHVDSLTEFLKEKERNETTLRQDFEELKKEGEEDRTRGEQEKRSLAAEMTKEIEIKQHRVDILTDIVREKEQNETTLRQQVEELKKEGEEDRTRGEQEKRSLAAEMTKEIESKKKRVDSLAEMLEEKERNETTLRQQVEESKKEREEYIARFEKEKRSVEQLERETWKLRTKIQLESEMRSAEQIKKKEETPQWSFIPWVTSGKQAQGGTSSSEDNSTGGMGSSDTLLAGEEPPDDEFAGILKQIADDLYDEAKIDSLGGQLGMLQGDI